MKKKNIDKKIFVLEGNIGVGKSTFLKILKKNLNVDVIYEPTEKWQNVNQVGNILDLFYKDIKRWAYTFQSYAFITRVQAQVLAEKNCESKNDIILERSVYCDRYCFAKNCFESGFMSELEWQIYKDWFSWLVEDYITKPNGFIYLRADPLTCFSRLNKRKRNEELEISLNYLKDLHNKHENWLIKKEELSSYMQKIPVLVLNCDLEFETNFSVQTDFVNKVNDFINFNNLAKNIEKQNTI